MKFLNKKITVALLTLVLCVLFVPPVVSYGAESSSLPEVRISLADGVTLEQINSGSKETKYSGNKVEITDSRDTAYFENVEIKGRGNFTWTNCPKKSYQIKFDSKVSLLGMPKAKKWILLANYGDVTLMRNKLAFDLAGQLGLLSPESQWVDLYVNGVYAGVYQLCEKNEVGAGRVDLKDDYGVLCEVDNNYGSAEEFYFRTALKNDVIVLSDSKADDAGEPDSKTELAFSMFQDKINTFEALLYSDDANWSDIEKLIDTDSFIAYYFIQELSENSDACLSSFFLYSDGSDDVIHLGPVWDFDTAFGQFKIGERGTNPQNDYLINIEEYTESNSADWFRKLLEHREFNDLLIEAYIEKIKPVFDGIPEMIEQYRSSEAFNNSVKANFELWDMYGQESVYGSTAYSYALTYDKEVERLLNWVDLRVDYLNSRYQKGVVILEDESETDAVGVLLMAVQKIRQFLKTYNNCIENIISYINNLFSF